MERNPITWLGLVRRLLAAGLLFLLANVLVYRFDPFFAKERSYDATVGGLFQRRAAHVLMLGDSHVARLDNSVLASTVYNAAFPGDSLRECDAKLSYLVDHDRNIDTVIMTADPHMFGDGRLRSSNRTFADRYFLVEGSTVGLEQGVLSAIRQQIPLLNDDYVQFLRTRINASLGPRRSNRISEPSSDGSWASLPDAERARRTLATGEGDHLGVGLREEPFEWYRRIVELARARKIRIIAVRYPANAEYFASLSTDQMQRVDRELAKMGISKILDFRYAFTNADDFVDADHLSVKGVLKLLALMEQQLDMPLLTDEARRQAQSME
jgi:hypothetical protein